MSVSDPIESYELATVHTKTNTWIGRTHIHENWVLVLDSQYKEPVEMWIPSDEVRLVQEGKSSINI